MKVYKPKWTNPHKWSDEDKARIEARKAVRDKLLATPPSTPGYQNDQKFLNNVEVEDVEAMLIRLDPLVRYELDIIEDRYGFIYDEWKIVLPEVRMMLDWSRETWKNGKGEVYTFLHSIKYFYNRPHFYFETHNPEDSARPINHRIAQFGPFSKKHAMRYLGWSEQGWENADKIWRSVAGGTHFEEDLDEIAWAVYCLDQDAWETRKFFREAYYINFPKRDELKKLYGDCPPY